MSAWSSIIKFILLLGSAWSIFWAERKGRDAEKLDNAEEVLDEVTKANKIADRIKSDPAYRKRVQDRFKREP